MTELVGYDREYVAENNDVELIPDFIREEIRLEIAQIFGNAKNDILMTTGVRNSNNKPYESILHYVVKVDSITNQMIEHLESHDKFGIVIDTIHYDHETRKIRLYVKCVEFWAKIRCARCSRDRDTDNERVQHHKEPPYNREFIY